MAATPTFVFDDDGKAYAYVAGKIVASGDDADALELKLADFPFDKDEDEEKDDEKQEEKKESSLAERMASATHVVTPNGLKGTILGKQKGLWGDQVTIRLENGRIARFDVSADETEPTSAGRFDWISETKQAAASPLTQLQEKLAAPIEDRTRTGLVARIKELKNLKHEAVQELRTANYTDETTINNIIVQADYELREITDALAALEEAEPYAPPAPFNPNVVEQEAVGGHDSTWLDHTLQEIIEENEAQDFDRIMEESPELLVADMETPALEDAVGVDEAANAYVSARTAGLDPKAVGDFRVAFLKRVREAREVELEGRRESATQQKQASTEEETYPDEGLFL